MALSDVGPPTGVERVYEDAIYGASAFAVVANITSILAALWITLRLVPYLDVMHRTMSPGRFAATLVGYLSFIGAYIIIRAESAFHAYLGYGASWQVTEHGVFFMLALLVASVLLAATCPWTAPAPGRYEVGARPVDGRP